MKTITVECTWKSTHEVEVPDDFEDTGHLDDFPAEALQDMTAHTAELVDWSVGRS
jgi:hypothetical protein